MKISVKQWIALITVGLAGQVAWTIENMYLNVFMYRVALPDPQYIARMVAASAIVATVTTLVMGNVSDRVGRRKAFISGGYILWGISIILFGGINLENAARLFPAANASITAATMIIVLDCVMTFFGSTANDAAFNAYVNDSTVSEVRGKVESVLAILPPLSMLLVFGALDPLVQQEQWSVFFNLIGGFVILVGIASLFLIREPEFRKKESAFLPALIYGFSPESVRKNRNLYLTMAAFCVFNIAVQIFFPYLIIYFSYFLEMKNYPLVLGIVLIIGSVFSVGMGPVIDRCGKRRMITVGWAMMTIGLVGLYLTRPVVHVTVAGVVMMSGLLLLTASLMGLIRDYTPEDRAGAFQGVRMVFNVMLPMIIGPFIGAALIRSGYGVYEELGQVKEVPGPIIFAAAAVVLAAIHLPVYFLRRDDDADAMG